MSFPCYFVGGPLDGREEVFVELEPVVRIPYFAGELANPGDPMDAVPIGHHLYAPRKNGFGRLLGHGGKTALDYIMSEE